MGKVLGNNFLTFQYGRKTTILLIKQDKEILIQEVNESQLVEIGVANKIKFQLAEIRKFSI